jgi:tripartite-type tricarboxylate transporter receptor subunit TctC
MKNGWCVAHSLLCMLACLAIPATATGAQSFPSKPIRMVVGLSPGGSTDVTARLVAHRLGEQFGQNVVVENRTGAGGVIAMERVATSPADGYTLAVVPASAAVLPVLRSKLPFDLERDFEPVSQLASGPYVLVVHPSVAARTIQELIELARSQPGKLSYGSDGVGTSLYLAGELFKLMAKVDITHVPYKGGAESAIANASGQVQITYPSLTSAQALIAAGKLRPLAVTSLKRTSLAPALPSLDESGLTGYDRTGWIGLLAPAHVPKAVIATLHAATVKVLASAEMKDALNKQGQEPQFSTPQQFAAFLRNEIKQNANLVKLTGIKGD